MATQNIKSLNAIKSKGVISSPYPAIIILGAILFLQLSKLGRLAIFLKGGMNGIKIFIRIGSGWKNFRSFSTSNSLILCKRYLAMHPTDIPAKIAVKRESNWLFIKSNLYCGNFFDDQKTNNVKNQYNR